MIFISHRPDFDFYAYFPKEMADRERRSYRIPYSPMIVYPDYRERRNTEITHLFSMLHEMGHHYHNHGMMPQNMPIREEAQKEVQAWCYVFECVKPQYFQKLLAEALKALFWTYGEKIAAICEAQIQNYIDANLNPGG